jgi:hypothetical protein
MEGKDKRQKTADSVVATIDIDHNGTISYEEFSHFITDGTLRKFTRRASFSAGSKSETASQHHFFGSKSEIASQQGGSSSAAITSNVRAAQDAAGKPISAGSLPAAMASTSNFFKEAEEELWAWATSPQARACKGQHWKKGAHDAPSTRVRVIPSAP